MSLGYIGSKLNLIEFISDSISNHYPIKNKTFADLFAGTGIVGRHFKDKGCKIISNDMEKYSWILNEAYLNSSYSDKLEKIIEKINNKQYGYEIDYIITETYCMVGDCERNFFSESNGRIIDYTRTCIECLLKENVIDNQEYYFLLASLLVSLNRYSNTTGVYGAYLKHLKKSAQKNIIIEPLHRQKNNGENKVYNNDIKELKLKTDILYLDPPYNTRQYSCNYFLLNYIIEYNRNIEIKGKTGVIKDWNRSSFCVKKDIENSIKQVLNNVETECLAFSYNNEGLLNKEELIKIFKLYFDCVYTYEKEYNRYKSQNNNNKKNVIEYLFVCTKNEII